MIPRSNRRPAIGQEVQSGLCTMGAPSTLYSVGPPPPDPMSVVGLNGELALSTETNGAMEGGGSGGLRQKVAKVWSVIAPVVHQLKVGVEHQGTVADCTMEGQGRRRGTHGGIRHGWAAVTSGTLLCCVSSIRMR